MHVHCRYGVHDCVEMDKVILFRGSTVLATFDLVTFVYIISRDSASNLYIEYVSLSSSHSVTEGCGGLLLHALNPPCMQCLLVSTVFGMVSSLPISFLYL